MNSQKEYVEISHMNLDDTLAALRQELERVTAAIAAIEGAAANPAARGKRGRKSMGLEERLAVSERMRRYHERKRAMSRGGLAFVPEPPEILTMTAGNEAAP